MWLPCGGHIEKDELPDDAAVREVREEAGVLIRLVAEKALSVEPPRQLLRPRGIQLEQIYEGHEHIDLIYLAVPQEPYDGSLRADDPSLGWYSRSELGQLDLSSEVLTWSLLALDELAHLSTEL